METLLALLADAHGWISSAQSPCQNPNASPTLLPPRGSVSLSNVQIAGSVAKCQ